MFQLVWLLIISGCVYGAFLPDPKEFDPLDGRIVGGEAVQIENFPYQVSIQTKYNRQFCGGSIITEDVIVTAAHCLQDTRPSYIEVRLGSTDKTKGGILVGVKTFRIHEDYNRFTIENDIAVVKLNQKIWQTTKIRNITLAVTTPKAKTKAITSGWGLTVEGSSYSPDNLRAVEVEIYDWSKCSARYGNRGLITTDMLCAYTPEKDNCQGDSGGPLVANGELVGVVSWGIGCARRETPGVYANVAFFNKWIRANANKM